ncbi:M48 family metallopeptidase [bacterium]|nr:M48 family metallopeptidase [bacterium]
MTILTASRYRVLPHISYKAFSYPGDEEALEALKKIPGVSQLFHWIIDNILEEYFNVSNLYNNVKLGPQNYPRIYAMVEECCQVLDVPMPEVYLTYSPVLNAHTYGVDRTFISIHSSMAESFTEAEMRSIIGHELGHIKAGHVLYKSVAWFILKYLPMLDNFVPFPIAPFMLPMLLAMQEWSRRAEFTCDRAGLLCCQDPEASMSALAKFAGRLDADNGQFSLEALIQQSTEVEEGASKTARLFVALDNLYRTHPYSVLRVKQINDWVSGGAYGRILDGEYPRDVHGEHELGSRIECPGCRKAVNSKLRYCPHCGTGLKKAGPKGSECQQCGTPLPAFTEYCGFCGSAVRGRSSGARQASDSNGAGQAAPGPDAGHSSAAPDSAPDPE